MNTVERVAQAIRKNPEGLLLLGAGVALMLRHAASGSEASRTLRSRPATDRYYGSAANDFADDAAGATDGVARKVSAAAEDVRNYVSETAHDLTDKASEYGNAATKRTREAAESAYRSTRDAADSAYKSVEGVIEAHPISIAVAGLAAGCLAAAVFPSTRFERETLGPIGRRAAEAASETGELVKTAAVARVTTAAMKAGEQLKDAMSEGKLSAQNLGDVARDVATDFTTNVTGGNATGGGAKSGGENKPANRPNDSRMAKAQL
jgi:hypothetical protein